MAGRGPIRGGGGPGSRGGSRAGAGLRATRPAVAELYIPAYIQLRFSWDEAKSRRTFDERGLDFASAARIFEGPTLDEVDDRRDYGEKRVVSIGRVEDRLLTVVWTSRRGGAERRIISARRSNRHERKRFEDTVDDRS